MDKSVLNSEIDIENYTIIRRDRNRNGGGVACYIRSDICFNELNVFSNEVENICFNILLKNLQPISVGVFYRPPNQNRFWKKYLKTLINYTLKKRSDYLRGPKYKSVTKR